VLRATLRISIKSGRAMPSAAIKQALTEIYAGSELSLRRINRVTLRESPTSPFPELAASSVDFRNKFGHAERLT